MLIYYQWGFKWTLQGPYFWLTFELRLPHRTKIQLSISVFTDLVHLINCLVRKVVGCRVVPSQPVIAACFHVIHVSTGHAVQAKDELCSPSEPTWNLSWHHPVFLEAFKPLECYIRGLLDSQTVARSFPLHLLFFFLWILSEDICDEGHQQPEPCVLTGNGVWTHIESEWRWKLSGCEKWHPCWLTWIRAVKFCPSQRQDILLL